ncbi:MAG TPA: N-carbamoylputrescine amidase [Gammaproteobacteria bacterium]|nr:N-carbamoylputrescine amidase [Gammaproteobacteria bacterium]
MSRKRVLAAIQLRVERDPAVQLHRLEERIREAAAQGAQVILLPELPTTPYFCKTQDPRYFELAAPLRDHPFVGRMAALARELEVVLPVSYFERAVNVFFNSLAWLDADGTLLGNYRKTHIPDGPGYQEKFYFSPGDTGFRVFETRYGRFGAGICWDQWFPETTRALALAGAEVVFFPSAIGSEPEQPELDSRDHWQRVMQGQAAANLVPLVAANRTGVECDDGVEIDFYGSSFITDWQGAKIAAADRAGEAVLLAEIDLDRAAVARRDWGLFRDRRPEMYAPLMHKACDPE